MTKTDRKKHCANLSSRPEAIEARIEVVVLAALDEAKRIKGDDLVKIVMKLPRPWLPCVALLR